MDSGAIEVNSETTSEGDTVSMTRRFQRALALSIVGVLFFSVGLFAQSASQSNVSQPTSKKGAQTVTTTLKYDHIGSLTYEMYRDPTASHYTINGTDCSVSADLHDVDCRDNGPEGHVFVEFEGEPITENSCLSAPQVLGKQHKECSNDTLLDYVSNHRNADHDMICTFEATLDANFKSTGPLLEAPCSEWKDYRVEETYLCFNPLGVDSIPHPEPCISDMKVHRDEVSKKFVRCYNKIMDQQIPCMIAVTGKFKAEWTLPYRVVTEKLVGSDRRSMITLRYYVFANNGSGGESFYPMESGK